MSEKRLPEVLLHLRTTAQRLRFQTAIAAAVAVILSCPPVNGQSAPSPTNQASGGTTLRRHAKPSATRPAAAQEQPTPAPVQPEVPHWPANDTPARPSVTWDSQGLKIDATNASLHEILNDVSTATGAKVEGFGNDERVFGEYGPGQARDVLSQLLHGSGYNVLMIGDQGEGTPRQIVLSARKSSSNNQPAGNRNTQDTQDDDVPDQPEVEEQPPQQPPLMNGRPPVIPPPDGPPGAPRTPQQVLQELQQRQQQMQEQQQQQQQQQPH